MALARVVSFEGVNTNRIEEIKREVSQGSSRRGSPRPRWSCSTTPKASGRS